MRSEGGPYAAQLAAEIMTELIGAVEALPSRPEAVRWLLRQLAADVVPALLLSLRTRCSTERERDATLRPICAVTQALMSHEAGTQLGTPTACSHTYALLSTLLGLAASRAPGTAPYAQYGAPTDEETQLRLTRALRAIAKRLHAYLRAKHEAEQARTLEPAGS
jgi:hypothetical protein